MVIIAHFGVFGYSKLGCVKSYFWFLTNVKHGLKFQILSPFHFSLFWWKLVFHSVNHVSNSRPQDGNLRKHIYGRSQKVFSGFGLYPWCCMVLLSLFDCLLDQLTGILCLNFWITCVNVCILCLNFCILCLNFWILGLNLPERHKWKM